MLPLPPISSLINSKSMKLVRFTDSLGVVMFLTACGSNTREKTTATDSTAAADSTAKAQAVNTIITTPTNVEVIMHKVADYTKWLAAYEAHDSARLASGLHNYVVARGLEDSNMVMVVTKVDDTAKASAFVKDPGLKEAMKKGGVVGAPMINAFTEMWKDTSRVDASIYAVTWFTVKDWDAWQKGFEASKQDRLDNGIVDRVYGHDLGNDKHVSTVTAMTDTAKAAAYRKSDAMKKRADADGIVGELHRFIFRIVKMY